MSGQYILFWQLCVLPQSMYPCVIMHLCNLLPGYTLPRRPGYTLPRSLALHVKSADLGTLPRSLHVKSADLGIHYLGPCTSNPPTWVYINSVPARQIRRPRYITSVPARQIRRPGYITSVPARQIRRPGYMKRSLCRQASRRPRSRRRWRWWRSWRPCGWCTLSTRDTTSRRVCGSTSAWTTCRTRCRSCRNCSRPREVDDVSYAVQELPQL